MNNIKEIIKNIFPYKKTNNPSPYIYQRSPFLAHHLLQSLYGVLTLPIDVSFQRQQIFFTDGGHICLDWVNKSKESNTNFNVPVLFVMHGMTGSTNAKYIRYIASQAGSRGHTCVCINSRGFNSEMTSHTPFIGLQFDQLEAALQRVKDYYPNRPLHLIGASLGGNYLLRYLISNKKNNELLSNLKSLILLCPPFDVKHVTYHMNPYYQKLFVKFYIEYLVVRHKEMTYWQRSGLVDFSHMKTAKTLIEFHQRITQKIVGQPIDSFLDRFKIEGKQLQKVKTKMLIISSKNDPMVNISTLPVDDIQNNQSIKLILTQSGGHISWYEGLLPKRWYSKPIFQFIDDVDKGLF